VLAGGPSDDVEQCGVARTARHLCNDEKSAENAAEYGPRERSRHVPEGGVGEEIHRCRAAGRSSGEVGDRLPLADKVDVEHHASEVLGEDGEDLVDARSRG
jgi:hypothetical protein